MRVLFYSYPSAFQNIGGGEILLLKLAEYLRKQDVDVKLFDMWNDRLEDYDLLHVFGSVKECLPLMRVAQVRKVKTAITPLFWSSWKRAFGAYGGLKEKSLFFLHHAVKVLCPVFPSKRREMLQAADLIFPNADMETKQISRLFAVSRDKMRVVFNGVDRRFSEAKAGLFSGRFGEKDFILSVGRIEPRKNQLNLIRAVRLLKDQRLVLIGNPVSGYEDYYEACQREGEGFTRFVPGVDHEDPVLASAYADCKLYALPAWFETPGMVAMEAALAGAPVAVTEGGSTRDYYGSHAKYFDPGSCASIALALQQAMDAGHQPELKKRILECFTWERVAEQTIGAYQELLSRQELAG